MRPCSRRDRRVHLTAGRCLTFRLSDDWEPMRCKLRELFAGQTGEEAMRVLNEVVIVMMESRQEILERQVVDKRRSDRAVQDRSTHGDSTLGQQLLGSCLKRDGDQTLCFEVPQ